MLARLARLIGDRLASALELPTEAAERAAFALENLFLFLLTLAAIVLAGVVSGLLWPALAAAATTAAMRAVTGGAHLSSPWRCILVSTILALMCGLAGRAIGLVLTWPVLAVLDGALVLTGMALLFAFAPAETPAKPIPPRQRTVLNRISLVLLAVWGGGILIVPIGRDLLGASVVGMAWQVMSITPVGYWLYHLLDRLGAKGGEHRCENSC